MKRIIIFILYLVLVSCDQPNSAYLKNQSDKPINTSIYFFNYNPDNIHDSQNVYIENLMKSPVIGNVKLTYLRGNIARIDFILAENSEIKLIYDTAPLGESTIEFEAIKITSQKQKIELYDKEKILDSFIPRKPKTKRYLIID